MLNEHFCLTDTVKVKIYETHDQNFSSTQCFVTKHSLYERQAPRTCSVKKLNKSLTGCLPEISISPS